MVKSTESMSILQWAGL